MVARATGERRQTGRLLEFGVRDGRTIGIFMIAGAVLLGAVADIALFQWEAQTRAATVQFWPTSTAIPAQATATPPISRLSAIPSSNAGAK